MRRLGPLLAVTVAVAVVAAALAGPAAAGVRQERVTLTVTVVDGNGNPLADATVNASWDGGSATETTKSNGKALVDVPAGERVAIDVRHANYVRNFPYVVEEASAREVTVGVARKGRATIRTTDGDGNPVSARVTVRTEGRVVTNGTSGSDGTFDTGTVERGEYTVAVFKSGYYRNATTLRVDGQVERRVALRQGSVVLEVTVRDDHFDPPRPVPEATVEVGDIGTVRTLGNGEATLKVPVNSRQQVTVSKDGYKSTTKRLTVFEQPVSLNATVQRVPALIAEPANRRVVVGESVRVEVTDEYGTPVEGATVTLGGETVGETNADGALRVPVESAGNHTLVASAEGVDSEPVTVEGVEPGGGSTTEPTEGTDSGSTPTETVAVDLPGFTPGVAVVGVLLAVFVLRRRR